MVDVRVFRRLVLALLVIMATSGAAGLAAGVSAAEVDPDMAGLSMAVLFSAFGALVGWAIVMLAWGPPHGIMAAAAPRAADPHTPSRPGAVEIYQSTLMHIWSDRVVTLKEAKTLANLRRKLGIHDEEARRLEDDVKEVLFGKEAT